MRDVPDGYMVSDSISLHSIPLFDPGGPDQFVGICQITVCTPSHSPVGDSDFNCKALFFMV